MSKGSEKYEQTLDKDDLTFDEKYIIEKMFEISKLKSDKDSENKKFIASMALLTTAALVVIAGVLSSTLGSTTKLELQEEDDEDDIDNY